ncbi:MAG TPA: hypothetical protein PK760_12885, partial [Flavobacteriales bacterium]|nr:hypothetical protein [Flavobacteriales bacterium]
TGLTVASYDGGGKMKYGYYSNGASKTVRLNDELVAYMKYDEYGRQTRLMDPNAGTTLYEYDAFGQLIWQKDADENITTFEYDNLGRKVKRTETEGNTVWSYFQDGQLVNDNVTSVIGLDAEFHYEYNDIYHRLTHATRIVDADPYTSVFAYDDNDKMISRTYPSGLQLDYSYTDQGNLDKVTWNGIQLFHSGSLNGQGQYVEYGLGSLPMSTIEYEHGAPTKYQTDQIQNLQMAWDYGTMNFTSRWDNLKSRREEFEYDDLNRLSKSILYSTEGGIQVELSSTPYDYDGEMGHTKGNLETKTDVGFFAYAANRITGAMNLDYQNQPMAPPVMANPYETQLITFTSYHQAHTLHEKVNGVEYDLTYAYGPDHQRCKSVLSAGQQPQETRYYLGDYEEQVVQNGTRQLHYVSGGDGLCAILVTENGATTMYHVFKDHLGSILTLVSSDGQLWGIHAERAFD